jgi:hypothetical protein
MESSSSGPRTGGSAAVNPIALPKTSPAPKTPVGNGANPRANLLTTLEKAIRDLPVLPDASETDEISVFAQHIPTDLAKDDAWEFLDPMLNRFLGFGRSVESISEDLRGGEMGLVAMTRYLKAFVGQYQIDIGLLEGKIQRLLEAIKMRCVPSILVHLSWTDIPVKISIAQHAARHAAYPYRHYYHL